jgi:hypothetical protein
MIVWLTMGMLGCVLGIFALVGALIKILKSAHAEAKAPTYWLRQEGARCSTSTSYYADGADEPDGSSYGLVFGGVRLE